MALYPTEFLTGNPHLDALEILNDHRSDAGVIPAGLPDDPNAEMDDGRPFEPLTDADVDAAWCREMERRDAVAAVAGLADDELIDLAAADADPDLIHAALAEIVRRLDARQPAAA